MSDVPTNDYTWQQGEDLVLSLIYNEGPEGDETPVDLTGWSLRMDIVDEDTRLFTFNSDDIPVSGVDVAGDADNEAILGNDGSISIVVPRALTLVNGAVYSRFLNGTTDYHYDIFLRNPANNQWPILRGTITVKKSYTLWP